jgi:hypothetical protein
MDKTEIKKQLYKQKPVAILNFIRRGIAYYGTVLYYEERPSNVYFQIPVDDMKDADFLSSMDAKLLIRWLVIAE